jgi:sulfatase maturation enzyme AslB (radical SAM superfamily)
LVLAEDIDKLTVSSDCFEVINMIKTKNLWRYSVILVEIQNLSSNLELVSFQHEYRESNQDAHLIARNAIAVQFGRRVWFLEPSDFVTLFAQVK